MAVLGTDDLDYLNGLIEQYDRPHIGDRIRTAHQPTDGRLWPNLDDDSWLKPPPRNPRLDPERVRLIDVDMNRVEGDVGLNEHEPLRPAHASNSHRGSSWELNRSSRSPSPKAPANPRSLSHELTTEDPDLPQPPQLERRHHQLTNSETTPSPMIEENVLLHHRAHKLQLELQSAKNHHAELQQLLESTKQREESALVDLSKCKETIRELMRKHQSAVEDRALFETKTTAALNKHERVRVRLEAEVTRQKDLVRDVTEEASRLRATLQEVSNETELCVQREKENWARAEALRSDQLIQQLKQDAPQSAHLADIAIIRDRDRQISQLSLQLAERQRLLEQQQKDNERLMIQATRLQDRSSSSDTSLLVEIKEAQLRSQHEFSRTAQESASERTMFSTELSEVKLQLKHIVDHFVKVQGEGRHSQAAVHDQISDLERRFTALEWKEKELCSIIPSRQGPITTEPGPDPAALNPHAQLAQHLQRATELGVDLPPHLPALHHPGKPQGVVRPATTSRTKSSSKKKAPIKRSTTSSRSLQARSPRRKSGTSVWR